MTRLEELRAKFQENPRRYFAPFANELRKSGDATQAIAICRTHLSGQPGHVSGHIVLGQALHEAGESAEARQAFTSALELDPENLIALRTMGEIAYANGELADARHWYERLLDADPRNTEVSQLLADLANVPQPVVQAPSEAIAAPIVIEQAPEAAPPLPPVAEPPALVFGTDPTEIEIVEPEASASTDTPARAMDAGFVVDDVDLFAPAADADPAVAPEPLVLSNPVADFVAPAGDEELLDIEDMDSFLSPTSSEVIEPEALETYESIVAASEPVAPDGPTAQVEVEEVEIVSAFEVAVPEAGAATPDEFTPDEAAPVEMVEARLPEPEAPVDEFAIEPVAADETEPVAGEERSGTAADMPASTEAVAEAGEFVIEPFAADALEPASPVAGEPVAELPDEWSLPPSMDAFEAAQVSTPAEPVVAEAIDVGEPDAGEPADTAPHATFAENGFEGSAHDMERLSWTTPGAAEFSDPEAAPDWFAEEPAEPEPVAELPVAEAAAPIEADLQPEPASAASDADDWFATAEEPVATAPDSTDDWFEPPVAEVPAEAQADDLYLAPDLAAMGSAPVSFDAPSLDAVEVPEPAVAEAQPEAVAAEAAQPLPVAASIDPVPDEIVATPMASTSNEEPLLPLREDFPQPAAAHTPRYTPAVGAEPSRPAPFVTETLAELYVKQGFREEALAIYRQLSERDPSDASLRERIAALESGGAPAAPMPDESLPNRDRGQSVRAFFGAFARRTPSASAVEARLERNAGAPVAPEVSTGESSFAAAASALANLFPASSPPSADEGAASKLAGAINESQPGGRPARAADRELSLDHLFRDVPASGTGGMMLDEFYAPPSDSSGPATGPSEATGSPDEGEADIRQFTAWLEGLRKK